MHDVFPKARFRDCIVLTEKAGHEAQLRVKRKQWIDDSKPKRAEDELGDVDGLEVLESMEREVQGILFAMWLIVAAGTEPVLDAPTARVEGAQDEPLFVQDDSDFDMDEFLQGSQEQNKATSTDASNGGEVATVTAGPEKTRHPERDEFEDELDALNEMDGFY
jgi:hypothetical protein